MKYSVKLTWNFHLILLGIPSSLILTIRSRGWEVSRNKQNLFSMMKVICQWYVGTKQLIKTNKSTNKKLSKLVLICGSIPASFWLCNIECHYYLLSLVLPSTNLLVRADNTAISLAWLVLLSSVLCFFQSALLLRWNKNRSITIKNSQTVGPFWVQHSAKLYDNCSKSCWTKTLLLNRYVIIN